MSWIPNTLTLGFQKSSPHYLAVDIIFIHGVQGLSSWEPSEKGKACQPPNWLYNQLPKEVPVSKVYSFEYAASWNSGLSVVAHAKRFLTELEAIRSESNVRSPIKSRKRANPVC